jgi:stage II sporulation protein AA (anti-sigma F factor antagonist)
MNINVTQIDNITAIGIQGRIDSSNSDALRDKLTALIQAGSVCLVLDFKDVMYISSSGFRVMLITARTVDRAGGKMVLCGMSKEIERLFDIAAFTTLFKIFPTRDEAVSALR